MVFRIMILGVLFLGITGSAWAMDEQEKIEYEYQLGQNQNLKSLVDLSSSVVIMQVMLLAQKAQTIEKAQLIELTRNLRVIGSGFNPYRVTSSSEKLKKFFAQLDELFSEDGSEKFDTEHSDQPLRKIFKDFYETYS